MSYATKEDVKALFRNFAPNSEAAVTDGKIEKWLEASTAWIDGKVGTLYSLPIDETANPLSFSILAQLESFKVAAIVDDVLNSYAEGDKKPQWAKRAQDMMNEIIPMKDSKGNQPEPTMKLPDAIYIGTNIQKATFKLSSTATPTFVKGADNW